LAETTGAYVKKGDPLYVEGRLEYRTFQDEEGKERGVCGLSPAMSAFSDGGSRMEPPQN